MDAPDDYKDVKLYRASSDLLAEITRRLGDLLTGLSDTKETSDHHPWVPDAQVQKLINLLEPFQEWPQLLDVSLPELVSPLVDAFLHCLPAERHQYRPQSSIPQSGISPLPSAICRILNTLCKVRGVKVITRFLNNEPKHLEPMLRALLLNQPHMDWQERYIILLWLSHLVLTPFDLKSISSSQEEVFTHAHCLEEFGHQGLPVIAAALISAGLQNLSAASKERESASRLLVRIALRPDMQRLEVLDRLLTLMFTKLEQYAKTPTASMYECLGYLSVISGIVKTASADDLLHFLTAIIDFCLKAVANESAESNMIRASAPARKILVATLRTSMLHAILLNSRDGVQQISHDVLYGMLEDSIQYFLDALGDRDTPVRLASSKALSVLVQKLDVGMKHEVAQVVLDTFEEDVLYETPDSEGSKSARLLTKEAKQVMPPNLTAVNPLKWQGLLMTLGHFIFRRAAPTVQLPSILKATLSGLDFEQRSASGISVGGSVRDAACFGIWSLARKYTTADLQSIEPAGIIPVFKPTFPTTNDSSVLQIVANHLVVSACLDPSGNIRRGSSAALQEMIGRHPDMIIQGITLVQVVDYHAVARRSRAMLDVTAAAAELAETYKWVLLNALLGWRGVRAVNDDSRRTAAVAISKLVSSDSLSNRFAVLATAHMQLRSLPAENSKSAAESRHGLLMTVSRILDTMQPSVISDFDHIASSSITNSLQLLWEDVGIDSELSGNLKGRFISELILEGVASLISSLARADSGGLLRSSEKVIEVLDLCLTRADHEAALSACADAAFELLSRLPIPQLVSVVGGWLDTKGRQNPSFSRKGRILALGKLYVTLPADAIACQSERHMCSRSKIFAQLTDFIQGEWPIETKVTALRSLKFAIPHLRDENYEAPLGAGLDNYMNDQRGDVGSLARFEAVEAVSILLKELAERPDNVANHEKVQSLVQRVFRLAGEKLDKLRFEAWSCIEGYMRLVKITSTRPFTHVVDVSSERYYLTFLRFLQVHWLQSCILQGIAHSITSGTEVLMRASRRALTHSTFNAPLGLTPVRILDILVSLLEESYTDDRQATPLLEVIAMLIEQTSEMSGNEADALPARKLWKVVRKAHFKSTNLRKLEAAVRIYAGLAAHGEMRENGLAKLRDLLLHPYPSIRNAAADALYIEIPNERLIIQNWSLPPKELKEHVRLLSTTVKELADIK